MAPYTYHSLIDISKFNPSDLALVPSLGPYQRPNIYGILSHSLQFFKRMQQESRIVNTANR